MLTGDVSLKNPEIMMAGFEWGARVWTDAVFWEVAMWASLFALDGSSWAIARRSRAYCRTSWR